LPPSGYNAHDFAANSVGVMPPRTGQISQPRTAQSRQEQSPRVVQNRAEYHMTMHNRPEQAREAQIWATQRAQATQSNLDPEQILYKCYRVHVSKSIIFSCATNTNYVYTLLRQLDEE